MDSDIRPRKRAFVVPQEAWQCALEWKPRSGKQLANDAVPLFRSRHPMTVLGGDQSQLDSGRARPHDPYGSASLRRKCFLIFASGFRIDGAIGAFAALLATDASIAPNARQHLGVAAT